MACNFEWVYDHSFDFLSFLLISGMNTRRGLLACFMYSKYHLHSKISKQGLFIRSTGTVLAFYRDRCMHFIEVTGRAHCYFLPPYVSCFGQEGWNRRFPEFPSILNCSVTPWFYMQNANWEECFILALILSSNWICFRIGRKMKMLIQKEAQTGYFHKFWKGRKWEKSQLHHFHQKPEREVKTTGETIKTNGVTSYYVQLFYSG